MESGKFHGYPQLDDVIYSAQVEHTFRQDRAEEVPIKRRGRRVKRRPNIAIISRYAQWAIEDSKAQE